MNAIARTTGVRIILTSLSSNLLSADGVNCDEYLDLITMCWAIEKSIFRRYFFFGFDTHFFAYIPRSNVV